MNLAEMKTALETSVKEVLEKSLDKGIDINAVYDANNGAMIVSLKQEHKGDDQESTLFENIVYNEKNQSISIVAFNRVFIKDNLGIAIVNNEPVAIDEAFMSGVKNVIMFGMDKVYHPENYNQDKSTTEETETAAEPVEAN